MDTPNTIPDFANNSSVQGLGQELAAYAVTLEARLAALETPVSPTAPAEEAPAPEETPDTTDEQSA